MTGNFCWTTCKKCQNQVSWQLASQYKGLCADCHRARESMRRVLFPWLYFFIFVLFGVLVSILFHVQPQ